MIEKQNKKSPTFQLIPQRITNNDKQANTRAYTVQCVKSAAKEMIHLMTHGPFRTTQMFIPFRYKTSHPDLFTKCIRQQNETYYKTWIIKLEAISDEAMEHLQQDIAMVTGVFHIVPTKRTKDIGEWKILLDQTKCSYIH